MEHQCLHCAQQEKTPTWKIPEFESPLKEAKHTKDEDISQEFTSLVHAQRIASVHGQQVDVARRLQRHDDQCSDLWMRAVWAQACGCVHRVQMLHELHGVRVGWSDNVQGLQRMHNLLCLRAACIFAAGSQGTGTGDGSLCPSLSSSRASFLVLLKSPRGCSSSASCCTSAATFSLRCSPPASAGVAYTPTMEA